MYMQRRFTWCGCVDEMMEKRVPVDVGIEQAQAEH